MKNKFIMVGLGNTVFFSPTSARAYDKSSASAAKKIT